MDVLPGPLAEHELNTHGTCIGFATFSLFPLLANDGVLTEFLQLYSFCCFLRVSETVLYKWHMVCAEHSSHEDFGI